jgi:hypothetical protein
LRSFLSIWPPERTAPYRSALDVHEPQVYLTVGSEDPLNHKRCWAESNVVELLELPVLGHLGHLLGSMRRNRQRVTQLVNYRPDLIVCQMNLRTPLS